MWSPSVPCQRLLRGSRRVRRPNTFQTSRLRRDWNGHGRSASTPMSLPASVLYVAGTGPALPRSQRGPSTSLSSSSTSLPAGFVRLAAVAGDAAALEDRLDVAVVLDVLDALLVAQAGLVLRVPLACRTRRSPSSSAAASASSGRRPRSPAWRRRCPRSAVGFWLWAWQPPQSLRTSPGRTWCQVWAMFSTMPSLSSVWNVKATSAGIFARKLVSGLPSGSSRLLAVRVELAHRDLAEDAQPLAGVVAEQPAGLRRRCGVGRRLHRQDADGVDVARWRTGPASAPWLPQLYRLPCCAERRLVRAGQVGGDAPLGGRRRRGKLSRLYRLDVPTRPNGVPSGRCVDSLPSLRERRQALRLVDAVDALVGHQRPRPLLVVLRVVLDEQHLRRLVDRLAALDEVDAGVEERLVGPFTVCALCEVGVARRPDGASR